MYRLTIKGKPFGPTYATETEMKNAYIRLWPSFHHLGWTK